MRRKIPPSSTAEKPVPDSKDKDSLVVRRRNTPASAVETDVEKRGPDSKNQTSCDLFVGRKIPPTSTAEKPVPGSEDTDSLVVRRRTTPASAVETAVKKRGHESKNQTSCVGEKGPTQNPRKILACRFLPPFLEFIKASNMPDQNCLGIFEVLAPSQLPERFTLSISSIMIWHQSHEVVSDRARCLTLKMLQGKSLQEIGYVHVSCDDMKSSAQCWELRKWKLAHIVHDFTSWFVMLGAVFEFLRQTHLKVLVDRGLSSLFDASHNLLTLENCCSNGNDFPIGNFKAIWRTFTTMSSCYAPGRSIWTIPAQPEDIYRGMLGCPGKKSIVFAHPK